MPDDNRRKPLSDITQLPFGRPNQNNSSKAKDDACRKLHANVRLPSGLRASLTPYKSPIQLATDLTSTPSQAGVARKSALQWLQQEEEKADQTPASNPRVDDQACVIATPSWPIGPDASIEKDGVAIKVVATEISETKAAAKLLLLHNLDTEVVKGRLRSRRSLSSRATAAVAGVTCKRLRTFPTKKRRMSAPATGLVCPPLASSSAGSDYSYPSSAALGEAKGVGTSFGWRSSRRVSFYSYSRGDEQREETALLRHQMARMQQELHAQHMRQEAAQLLQGVLLDKISSLMEQLVDTKQRPSRRESLSAVEPCAHLWGSTRRKGALPSVSKTNGRGN